MASDETVAEGESWTNPSVRLLTGDNDPLQVASDLARAILTEAADAGLNGPPIDPFALAELLGLSLRARADIADARISGETVGVRSTPMMPLQHFIQSSEPLVVEYNPTRPRGRLRYNVAHEIAHALFPDVAHVVRHRTGSGAVPGYGEGDAWQLELLCNVIAAELLMPEHAVAGLVNIDPDIDFIMEHRRKFDVSTEALLRRLATASTRSVALVSASRIRDTASAPLAVEYVVPSTSFTPAVKRRAILPPSSTFGQCLAVGQTARGHEPFDDVELDVQAVGTPPYPGRALPRVLALVQPTAPSTTSKSAIIYRTGDISELAAGDTPILIAHVVTDSARVWSRRGVAGALAARFPDAARAFRAWSVAESHNLSLGNVHTVHVSLDEGSIYIASMVVQRGYGPGVATRLDYEALRTALGTVGAVARRHGAEVHLPRIGAGQAGGRWDLIAQTIETTLVDSGIPVTVYTLPARPRGAAQ